MPDHEVDTQTQARRRRPQPAADHHEHLAPPHAAVLGLQRLAGNRAVTRAITVQRDGPNAEDYNPVAQYNPLGVGAPDRGLLHTDVGKLRLDAGLGEASAGYAMGGGLTGRLGYQYGSNMFAGVEGQNWSARGGLNPGTRMLSAGVGYGAPLLPMPNLLTDHVNAGYGGLMGGQLGPAATAAGDLAAVGGDSPKEHPYGFGLNAGYNPEEHSGYVGAGFVGHF